MPVTTSAVCTQHFTHFTDAKYLSTLNLLLFNSLPFKVQMFVVNTRERKKNWGSGLSSHFHSTHVTKISHHSTNQMSFVMTSALSVYRHLPTYIQCARARGGYYLSTMTRFMYLSILSKEYIPYSREF